MGDSAQFTLQCINGAAKSLQTFVRMLNFIDFLPSQANQKLVEVLLLKNVNNCTANISKPGLGRPADLNFTSLPAIHNNYNNSVSSSLVAILQLSSHNCASESWLLQLATEWQLTAIGLFCPTTASCPTMHLHNSIPIFQLKRAGFDRVETYLDGQKEASCWMSLTASRGFIMLDVGAVLFALIVTLPIVFAAANQVRIDKMSTSRRSLSYLSHIATILFTLCLIIPFLALVYHQFQMMIIVVTILFFILGLWSVGSVLWNLSGNFLRDVTKDRYFSLKDVNYIPITKIHIGLLVIGPIAALIVLSDLLSQSLFWLNIVVHNFVILCIAVELVRRVAFRNLKLITFLFLGLILVDVFLERFKLPARQVPQWSYLNSTWASDLSTAMQQNHSWLWVRSAGRSFLSDLFNRRYTSVEDALAHPFTLRRVRILLQIYPDDRTVRWSVRAGVYGTFNIAYVIVPGFLVAFAHCYEVRRNSKLYLIALSSTYFVLLTFVLGLEQFMQWSPQPFLLWLLPTLLLFLLLIAIYQQDSEKMWCQGIPPSVSAGDSTMEWTDEGGNVGGSPMHSLPMTELPSGKVVAVPNPENSHPSNATAAWPMLQAAASSGGTT